MARTLGLRPYNPKEDQMKTLTQIPIMDEDGQISWQQVLMDEDIYDMAPKAPKPDPPYVDLDKRWKKPPAKHMPPKVEPARPKPAPPKPK